MTDQQQVEPAGDRGLGIRHNPERRHDDRRAADRGTRDRRWGVRRRAQLRSLIFTAMALSVPPQIKHGTRMFTAAQPALEARAITPISMNTLPPSRRYDNFIHEAAELYRLSPTLIRSVMQAESAFDPMAISGDGAMGLMQLMPEIAGAFGITDPFDPRENIMGGARLLRELLDSHHNNIRLVLAAYNAGPKAVARYGGVPPFRETRGYVKKIITLIEDANSAGGD
jgi:soluble lytic murein transglycosylase-like protein